MNHSFEEQSERITLIGNIQSMQTYTYGHCAKFNVLDRYKTEALRQEQEELVPKYNEVVRRKRAEAAEAKAGITKLCAMLIEDATPYIEKMCEKAIHSSAINAADWSIDNNPMILPKSILIAALIATADQYSSKGTSFEKESAKIVKSLSYIL